MASHPIPNCLSKATDLWLETATARVWLEDAISYVTNSIEYGEQFNEQFAVDFFLQKLLAEQECKRREDLIAANITQPNGSPYVPSAASHVDNMSRLLRESAVWIRFYNLLPKSDFPDNKYINKNHQQLVRVFSLNLLHPDPISPA